jgi:hypothetical protein
VAVTIKRRSRLNFGNLLTIDGYEFWDLLELPTIVPQVDDIFYQVKGADRIDRLAFKFYGESLLWWVIAAANDLEFLPTDLNEGLNLRIPSAEYVRQILFQKAT